MVGGSNKPRTLRYYADEVARQLQDSTDSAMRDIDTERPWGTPTTDVKTSTYHASFGEIVLCDPSDGAFTVYLPAAEAQDEGRVVVVKNLSSSTNHITVQGKGGATIDSADSRYLSIAWQVWTFVVRNANEWIRTAFS